MMKKMMCMMLIVAVIMTGCESAFQNSHVDKPDIAEDTLYAQAEAYLAEGKIAEAAIAFGGVAEYEDAAARSDILWNEYLTRNTLCAGNAYTIAVNTGGCVELIGDLDDVFYMGDHEVVNEWKGIIEVAACHRFAVGLKSNGDIVVAGDDVWHDMAAELVKNAVMIEAYDEVFIALQRDGTVQTIGRYGWGETDQWTNVVNVCSGGTRVFGVIADGTVCVAGDEQYNNCDVENWTDIVDIDASEYHTVGLKSDGTVVATGFNGNGQCDVTQWTDIVDISVGKSHTLGLKSDGTVVATGLDLSNQCQVSDWTNIVAVSAGVSHSVGLKSDGTVVATPYENYAACDVDGWNNIAIPHL